MEQAIGGLLTRAVGTVQPPVVAATNGAVITGVAGAQFSDITEDVSNTPATLDNTRIVFVSQRDGSSQIYTVKRDGSDLRKLTSDATIKGSPSWSPDGTRIAFVRTGAGGQNDIYSMKADGTDLRPLATGPSDEIAPSWSPDGTKIAYSERQGTSADHNLKIMNAADGTGKVNVTSSPAFADFSPSWSPDGTMLVFSRRATGSGLADIFTVPAQANSEGSLTQITSARGRDEEPSFSPDGRKIVFMGDRGNQEIYTVNAADGSSEVNVSQSAGIDKSPSWSPDGALIVFSASRSDTQGFDLKIAQPIANANAPNLASATGDDTVPNWSRYQRRPSRKFLGSGGLMGAAASGFLVGQRGKNTASLVTFDINNTALAARTNVTVTPLTTDVPGAPNVVFSLGFATPPASDVFNAVRFLNGGGSVATVVGPGGAVGTAGGAVVSFDAADGSVASLIPFGATRAQGGGGLQKTREGSVLILRGAFPAVFDGGGRNVAPQGGAREVRLDAKTGRLLNAG